MLGNGCQEEGRIAESVRNIYSGSHQAFVPCRLAVTEEVDACHQKGMVDYQMRAISLLVDCTWRLWSAFRMPRSSVVHESDEEDTAFMASSLSIA